MLRSIFRFIGWFAFLCILLPIAIATAIAAVQGWPANWRTASWQSAGLLPEASASRPASVMVLAARTGRWKGIFAEHMSIVLKDEGATSWTRYDVVGWGNPVRRNAWPADANWYGNRPRIIYRLDGAEAARLIPAIEKTIAAYPYQQRGSYTVWPGPNSNSFVAHVVRHTPGFAAELSAAAVGKDWLGPGLAIAPAPSKTGYSFAIAGMIGGTIARAEGLELHLLGSTIGIDVDDLAIKLPALGKLSLL
ncbi:MAG: DUF3750 domain-containing protein [Proteobacteria bacterium]|nr:DUF3750 domain-containing protein [Pseudomonadota bacterium]